MAIYFFDKNQTLIKIVPESATFEAIQTQELDDDSLLKDTLSVTVKGDEKLLDAEYMAVKSYKGNAQTFDMYRIVTDTTPDKSMSFTGMSLAPYELNGHILQDLRPANHSLSYTLNRVLDGTDWRVGYIDDGLSNVTTTFYYVSVKEALKELQSLVGCEFVFKVEISGQKITDKWIEVYKEMGNRTKKRFNYGTNALTVVRETNKADIYTALIGRGKGEEVSSGEDNASGQAGYGRKITFEDIEWSTAKGDPLNKPKGQYYLELPQATQAYGIKNIDGTMKARVGIVDFDDEEDKNRLINLTYQQLLVSSRSKVLFKTTVANVGATGIGDTVTIHRHDLNIHYQTRVRKIVRNKLNDNKTQVELGDAVVTPSTKRAKENNATIKNLNQEIEKVKADVTISQTSADGKNTIFYGSAEPERKRTGDTWYRPHPSIAGETQMLVWNGTAWELVIDTSDLASVSRAVEDAAKIAGEAFQATKDADAKANSALEKAGANANLLTTHQNTINTINTTTLPAITSSAQEALANAKSAMDEAKKADGKIAEYVKENGLVNGTTVDAKIDSATGEITAKITELETSKLDSTTYTNFYENDYKRTAKGVTDAWTAVNKIVDKDGNTTDTFAKAVYDKNATRQSADFQNVTKDLVKTATYTTGINGVTESISSIRGNISDLSKARNLLKQSFHNSIESPSIVNTNYTIASWELEKKLEVGKTYTLRLFGYTNREQFLLFTPNGSKLLAGEMTNTSNKIIRRETTYNGFKNRNVWEVSFTLNQDQLDNMTSDRVLLYNYPETPTTQNGEVYWASLVEGSVGIDWSPSLTDNLGKAEFQIFKGDYERNDERIKSRLTAIDSGKEGSIAYRLNETESTVSGNTTTISNIKTKPGEQITGYQIIKDRSDLYERVIGSTNEATVKQNVSRIVMTDSVFQTEVIAKVDINTRIANATSISIDPNFSKGLEGVAVYNIAPNNTNVSLVHVKNLNSNPTHSNAPNNDTMMEVTSRGQAQPDRGGFRVLTTANPWYEGGEYVLEMVGKLNTNASLEVNYNSLGVGGQVKWLTDNKGKGDYFKYQFYAKLGKNFSAIPLFFVSIKEPGDSIRHYQFTRVESFDLNYTSSSKITQLADNINLKVSKSDLISQINVQAGGVLITSGTNKLNVTPETTYIENGTIKSAMIESLEAGKIKTGTLDAGKVKVINIDAENITANKTSFVQSAWNDISSEVAIDGSGIETRNTNGDFSRIVSGELRSFNANSSSTAILGSGRSQFFDENGSQFILGKTLHGNEWVNDGTLQVTHNRRFAIGRYSDYAANNGVFHPYISLEYLADKIGDEPSGIVRLHKAVHLQKDIYAGYNNISGLGKISFHNGGHIESQSDTSNLLIVAISKIVAYASGSNAFEIDSGYMYLNRNLSMEGNKITNQSDRRLKTNIVDTPVDSLSAISNWNFKSFDRVNNGNHDDIGLIAQDTSEIVLYDEENDIYNINSSKQIMMNSHAIQQSYTILTDEITKLKAEVANLKDELALLKGA